MRSAAGLAAVLAAVLAAGLAVVLVLPGRPGLRGHADGSGRSGAPRRLRPGPGVATLVVVLAAALVATMDGRRLALSLIVLASASAGAVLARRARVSRAAERRQALVVEVCEALVGELRAGQPLVTSLEHCAEVWPDVGPVVAASRLGADVPQALRRLAEQPGAAGLREVAAAWQVSQASGAGLAAALAQVAGTARERQATRHLVRGELASAQATARLVALLPVASLAMSSGIGGDPWHFLLDTPVGLGCLALGAAFAVAGLLWIDAIAAGVLRG
jgi:tight adherence protein B